MFGDLVIRFYILDMVELARKSPKTSIPESYNLSTAHNYFTGIALGDSSHCAMADLLATVKILQYESFWNYQGKCVYKVDRF
jgi:DNA polymerase III epsilon subunit-like protein